MQWSWILSYLLGSRPSGEYGLDTTYPACRLLDAKENPFFASRYQAVIEGCYRTYSFEECNASERQRMEINSQQPSTHVNYTETGFVKLQLPDPAWRALMEFYEMHKTKERPENWNRGDTYVNHWEAPTMVVDIGISDHGRRVRELVEEVMQPIVDEWLGYPAELVDAFGLRIYKRGSILAPHVDRLPCVVSAVIQVGQEASQPWPLELFDHHGKAHNVTLEPRDVLLYESHTIIHGRPFPFEGSSYASLFLHYKPFVHDELNAENSLYGWGEEVPERVYDALPTEEHNNHGELDLDESSEDEGGIDEEEYHAIIKSQMERIRRAQHFAKSGGESSANQQKLDEVFRAIAQQGLHKVLAMLDHNPDLLNQGDSIGWTVAYEAVRRGDLELLQELDARGADLLALLTTGEDLYDVATNLLGEEHEVTEYLYQRLQSEENEL